MRWFLAHGGDAMLLRLFLTAASLLSVCALAGCAGGPRDPGSYLVTFSATRTADHQPIVSAAVPVRLGGHGSVKTASRVPAENQPALPEFAVRLKRAGSPGLYELVTRVWVYELVRNRKGKLKKVPRFLGALVPTRLGQNEVVSPESDPIHLEARLERR